MAPATLLFLTKRLCFRVRGQEEDARAAKSGLHATTPPISGLARKQGLAVEVATHKGYETALKKAGKPIPPATAL